MARIVLVSAAYYGDVLPFVPVADELVRRGHEVTYVVPSGFHDLLAPHAFELADYGVDFSPRVLADHGDLWEGRSELAAMRRLARLWVGELSAAPRRRIHAAVDRALDGADLLLTHNTAAALSSLPALERGIPWLTLHLFPMMIPSAESPPPMLPGMALPGPAGRVVRRGAWRVGFVPARGMMSDSVFRDFRRELGLPDRRDNIALAWQDADRVLVLSPPGYHSRRGDWPDTVVHTGFTVYDGPPDAPLPDDLVRYLDAGAPPVLVTLGTSAASNARDGFAMAAAAVERLGRRALLLVGNERNRAALAGRDDVWTFAPLTRVLPRCGAVIHAGGHGTTAATLLAGLPSVVLPQGFDQGWHARRVEELGAGVALPWRQRTVDRIAAALERATAPAVATRAGELAATFGAVDGTAVTADEVDRFLAQRLVGSA